LLPFLAVAAAPARARAKKPLGGSCGSLLLATDRRGTHPPSLPAAHRPCAHSSQEEETITSRHMGVGTMNEHSGHDRLGTARRGAALASDRIRHCRAAGGASPFSCGLGRARIVSHLLRIDRCDEMGAGSPSGTLRCTARRCAMTCVCARLQPVHRARWLGRCRDRSCEKGIVSFPFRIVRSQLIAAFYYLLSSRC